MKKKIPPPQLRTIAANDLVAKVWKPTGKLVGEPRLISKNDVLFLVPIHYVSLWKMMQAGEFPRAVAIGCNNFWKENEVKNWLENQPLRRFKNDRSKKEMA